MIQTHASGKKHICRTAGLGRLPQASFREAESRAICGILTAFSILLMCSLPIPLALFCGLPCAFAGSFQEDSPAAAVPDIKDLRKSLEDYHSAFFGMSFDSFTESKRDGQLHSSPVVHNSVSRDGMIWETSSSHEETFGNARIPGTLISESKANAQEGWIFNANARFGSAGEPLDPPALMVTFYTRKGWGAVGGRIECGFIECWTFSDYVAECQIGLTWDEGTGHWILDGDHPSGPSVQFRFDSDLILRGFTILKEPGDLVNLGQLHLPTSQLPTGVWSRVEFDIQYDELHGRRLPVRIHGENTNSQFSATTLTSRFTNYLPLENDLGSMISLSAIRLPENDVKSGGYPVFSQGETGIAYELRDGRIVKVLDAGAVEAASVARVRGRQTGLFWYLSLGAAIAISVGIMVWLRNR